jgi:cell division protein FtsW (lipid II flippase)
MFNSIKTNIMKTLVIILSAIGLLSLNSCKQDTDVNTMMHNNGDYYYWGMHMGWWIAVPLILILLIVLFYNSRKNNK